MGISWVACAAQLLLFVTIADRTATFNGNLALGLLLKATQRIALGPQDLASEVELRKGTDLFCERRGQLIV